MMQHFLALIVGFCIDLLLGDPGWLPHPVQGIGWMIARLEHLLRRIFPDTKGALLAAGAVLAILVTGLTGCATWLCLHLAGLIAPWVRFGLSCIICWQILATKSLRTESMKVASALQTGTLDDGRRAVSMIVGRDTAQLSQSEVLSAAVETVAENTADGIVAPLIFAALLGPVGGMCYKAVNTMDSMVGYRNERYIYFGRAAAKLDDVCNFFPARLAGLLMCAAAAFSFDARGAWHIFRRDRKKHLSPNSAQTEAACAGALGLQLGGAHLYFGKLVEKPTIGDAVREISSRDVKRANDLALLTALLSLFLFAALPLAIHFIINGRLL